MVYTAGFKARMVERMTGSEGISATALASEVGVGQPTLSRWVREASTVDGMSKKKRRTERASASKWTAEEKLRAVMASASLSDEDLGAFLRREGVREAQLAEWREAATEALKARPRRRSSPEAKKIRELEKDLRRKEKALAEVTALLALKKKITEIWGDADDHTAPRSAT